MAKYLVSVFEEQVVTYAVEAESMEEAKEYAEYEAGESLIVNVKYVGRDVVDCELA